MIRKFAQMTDTAEDVDRLLEMLERISKGQYKGNYELIPETGEYFPAGYEDPLEDHFLLESMPTVG